MGSVYSIHSQMKFLEDGSDLFIDCDDRVDVLVIKDGKCIQEK